MSQELTVEFGEAFTLRSLYRVIQFCQCFSEHAIVSALSTQFIYSWRKHFGELAPSDVKRLKAQARKRASVNAQGR